MPDTIPDLAAAIAQQPTLRTLSLAGYHDLATPFRQTELDVARLGAQPRLTPRVYPGGHMTYLDDGSRARIKADVAALVTGPAPVAANRAARHRQTPARAVDAGQRARRSRVRRPARRRAPTSPKSLAQGGDPYLPPALRVPPAAPSPSGAALKALVERKIAERSADVYR